MTRAPVLVVDDDPSILATVSELLDLEGYPFETATNGAEALSILQRVRPSVVLLDMRMPVLDGWGFCTAMRQSGTSIPVVVMTAAQDARQWAEEIGAAGYVAKPFDLTDILSAIDRVAGAN